MPEDKITKTQRWLDLIALLLGRKMPLAVGEIMERVPAYARAWTTEDATQRDSARRMFERDKDDLRALGIPIETVECRINYGTEMYSGYRIGRREFYLPRLRVAGDDAAPATPARSRAGPHLADVVLEPAEVRHAVDALVRAAGVPNFPLADAAHSALRKLGFDLDLERFRPSPVLWVERPGVADVLGRLDTLSAALLARKRVQFRYGGIRRNATTERDVAPYGLFFQRDWYFVGHDALRQAIRVFRVTRMDELSPNRASPRTADYSVPNTFRLADYLNRDAWHLSAEDDTPATVDVAFAFPAALWAERNGEGTLVETRPDGSAVRRFTVHEPEPFLRWVLGMAGETEILVPLELRAALDRLAADVLALYDPEPAVAHG